MGMKLFSFSQGEWKKNRKRYRIFPCREEWQNKTWKEKNEALNRKFQHKITDKALLLTSFLLYQAQRPIRNQYLNAASRLQYVGEKKIRKGKHLEGFKCFVSSMKIHERHAKWSLELASSYARVGRAILDKEFISKPYARVAVKCFCLALSILRVHYYHQTRRKKSLDCYHKTRRKSSDNKRKNISVLDIATLNCYISKAFLLVGNVGAAYEHANHAVLIIKLHEEGNENVTSEKCSKGKYSEFLVFCYLTFATTLANRMENEKDKIKAMHYYHLTIELQEKRGGNSFIIVKSHHELAAFLHDVGDLDGALRHYNSALLIQDKKNTKKNHDCRKKPTRSYILNNIALVHRDMGQVDEAKDYFKRAVANLRPNSSKLEAAIIFGNMGRLYNEYID